MSTEQQAAIVSEIRCMVLDIRDLYRELPDTIAAIAGLHAVTYTAIGSPSTGGVKVLGGDAAVMHGAGTDNGVTSSRAGNREHAADNLPSDPPSVLGVLTRIEDQWRQELGDEPAMVTTVTASCAYLVANVSRALQVLGMSADIADLTAPRTRLRNVTGHTDTPKPSDAPCDTCNGRIVQRYTKTGMDDVRECSKCGKKYTATQYARAVDARMAIVRNEGHRIISASEARTIWGLSEDRIYNWERGADDDRPHRQPKIVAFTHDRNGRKHYLNADIAALLAPKAIAA